MSFKNYGKYKLNRPCNLIPNHTKLFSCHVGLKGVTHGAGAHSPPLPHKMGKEHHWAESRVFVLSLRSYQCLRLQESSWPCASQLWWTTTGLFLLKAAWPHSWPHTPGWCVASLEAPVPAGCLPPVADAPRVNAAHTSNRSSLCRAHTGGARTEATLLVSIVTLMLQKGKDKKDKKNRRWCRELSALQWHVFELPCVILKWQKIQMW